MPDRISRSSSQERSEFPTLRDDQSPSAVPRIVRVAPDVTGVTGEFDYLVPESVSQCEAIVPGTVVRVPLGPRRVRGWVTQVDPLTDDETHGITGKLKPILKVSGRGPDSSMLELCRWAAWRWAGTLPQFLRMATSKRSVPLPRFAGQSASRIVPSMPNELATTPRPSNATSDVLLDCRPFDRDLVAELVDRLRTGPHLVIVPHEGQLRRLVAHLQRLGRSGVPYFVHDEDNWGALVTQSRTVLGTRAAAFAPLPLSDLRGICIVDAHEEALVSERTPTWNAITLLHERARRAGVPLWLTSPVPRPELLAIATRTHGVTRWPRINLINTADRDPREGLFSEPVLHALRGAERGICVLNRKGKARLLVCQKCTTIADCPRCESALVDAGDDLGNHASCPRCGARQPFVCRHCGSTGWKRRRLGVSSVAPQLEAALNRPVGEVTGESTALPNAAIVVGTSAVLHRVRKADVVVFLDFDSELTRETLHAVGDARALLAQAAGIVGWGTTRGMILVQTTRPQHPAFLLMHPDADQNRDEMLSWVDVVGEELHLRERFAWPPHSAMAVLSGAGVEVVQDWKPSGVQVVHDEQGRLRLKAPSHDVLCEALAMLPRHSGKPLRVDVDPIRA